MKTLSPPLPVSLTVPPACLLDPALGSHEYVTANGIKFHCVSAGDKSKPLMLLVHGFPEVERGWEGQGGRRECEICARIVCVCIHFPLHFLHLHLHLHPHLLFHFILPTSFSLFLHHLLLLCFQFWFSWRYQLREFSRDYHVVAIDMRCSLCSTVHIHTYYI